MEKKSIQRRLINRKRFNTSVDIELLDKLDKLSLETQIPKSKLIDKSLKLLFKEYEEE